MYIAFHDGDYNYAKMMGYQGLIMYPAGHVYVFWLIEKITFGAKYIPTAIVMGLIHSVQTYFTVKIYEKGGIPGEACYLLLLLFNERGLAVQGIQDDSIMIVFLIIGIYFLQTSRMSLASLALAASVSIKGGAVLWLPGILLVTTFSIGLFRAVLMIAFIVAFNMAIGYPFLMTNSKAFLT